MSQKNLSKVQFLFLILVLVYATSCTGGKDSIKEKLIVKGSETMLPLFIALGEKYNESTGKPIGFDITGGGSQSGIMALKEGNAQICMSSKIMQEEDKDYFIKSNKKLVEVPLALDAIVIGINNKNLIEKLTIEQLRKIYSGEITNWSALGGDNISIVPLSREEGSGSLAFFKDKVMGNYSFGNNIKVIADAPSLLKELSTNTGAIAFFGSAHKSDSVKLIPISKDGGQTYISPEESNVRSKSYPFVIPLNLYFVAAEDSIVVKKFISFATSKSGRYKITDMGFTPVLVKE